VAQNTTKLMRIGWHVMCYIDADTNCYMLYCFYSKTVYDDHEFYIVKTLV